MTESREHFQARPRWVRWALVLQWVVIPILVFKGLSLGVRYWLPAQPKSFEATVWQARGHQAAQFQKIDCVFLGSSRVMAAVDEAIFATELSKLIGRPIAPLNLGLACSTPMEHYALLRNLFREHAEQMRGCTVFIEAPAALPPDTREWHHAWVHPDRPEILRPLLRADDLLKVWTCGLPLEERLAITKDYFGRKSTLLAQRRRVATAFVAWGNRLMRRLLGRFVPHVAPGTPPAVVDLTTRGGIRTDWEGVQLARKVAVEQAHKPALLPRHVTEHSVLSDLVKLVHREGGRVVFFEMPMHRLQGGGRNDPGRTEDRRIFQEQIRSWNARYVPTTIATVDEDFPDVWHLRRSLAAAFSTSLAHGWADLLKREASD